MRDERANIAGRRVPEVHHDVRVDVGDLRIAHAKSLQPALVDETSGAYAFDLLEDRPGTRVNLEPRVTRSAPAQVLLHDAMHCAGVTRRELKGHRQRDLVTAVENARIVPESHVRPVHQMTLVPLIQELGGFEHFLDEHRALTLRRGRQKVQVLPDCPANGARDTDVVLQARQSATDRFRDEIAHDDATLAPHSALLVESHMTCGIANNDPAEPGIPDEYVRTQPEHEERNARLSRRSYGVCEIVGGSGIVEEVGRTPNAKRGVWREGLAPLESRRVEPVAESQSLFGQVSVRHGNGKKTEVRGDHQLRTNHISARIGDRGGTVEGTAISGNIRKSTRRPVGLLHALALVAVALTAAPAHAQRAELDKIIKRRVLANGLEVIVVENHGVPLATVEIDVKNGSFTQTPEYAGLAHMYEHMFFKANAHLPEPDQFIDRAAELGAVFNGRTDEERVAYYMTLPADSLAGGMQSIADALRAPLFLKEEIERERQVVIGEYDRNESNPYFKLQSEISKRLYPGQWSRKNVIGDRNVILGVTPEKMRVIQQKYYVPNNSVLVVTGDVMPDSVFALAERTYSDWPKGADPFVSDPIPAIPTLQKSDALIIEQPVGAVTVLIQWQGPSVRKDPKATYAADVFSDALNQPNSTLQKRLVDTGLWQSIGVNYYTLDHVGPITISGQTTPEKLKSALAALDGEIQRFTEPGYISKDELDAVKAQRAVSSAFGRERASGFSQTIGFWWSVADLEYYMGYVDNMATQSLADLRGYAAKYIVGKPRITGVVIPADARQSIALTAADLLPRGVAQ
jgi:zinc protease